MNINDTTPAAGAADWNFSTLAEVWDYKTRAIITGADGLEALSDANRTESRAVLSERIQTLASDLDDGWLVLTAFSMIEDLYKSYLHQFRWSPGVHSYIAATAQTFVQELEERGFVLHYVIDGTQPEAELDEKLTYIPPVFQAAGLLVTGPQLVALELMQRVDHQPRDITAIPSYRAEGHEVADLLITRCHQDRRSSVYLNLDLAGDTPGLSLDVALSPAQAPGTIVVFRDQPPAAGSFAHLASPPGVVLPELGGQE
jgi:hypothetical protein